MKSKLLFSVLILLVFATTIVLFALNKKVISKKEIVDNSESIFGTLNPNAPPQTIQFGKLAGKWDCTSYDLQQDSTWYKSKATWIFKYTLNGFAIEDTWIEKASDSTNNTTLLKRDFHGINMRLFNPKLKKWQCVWLDNRQNTMSPIWHANYNEVNKELLMYDQTQSWKITFFNMNTNSFDWNYKVLKDSTWTIVSRIRATKLK